MDQLQILSLTLDKVFQMDLVPEQRLTPPSEPEENEAETRTLVAEYLDTNALDPESIMHMAASRSGERENLFKQFREQAANAIDLESAEAYQALGKTAAAIIFQSVRREL